MEINFIISAHAAQFRKHSAERLAWSWHDSQIIFPRSFIHTHGNNRKLYLATAHCLVVKVLNPPIIQTHILPGYILDHLRREREGLGEVICAFSATSISFPESQVASTQSSPPSRWYEPRLLSLVINSMKYYSTTDSKLRPWGGFRREAFFTQVCHPFFAG